MNLLDYLELALTISQIAAATTPNPADDAALALIVAAIHEARKHHGEVMTKFSVEELRTKKVWPDVGGTTLIDNG